MSCEESKNLSVDEEGTSRMGLRHAHKFLGPEVVTKILWWRLVQDRTKNVLRLWKRELGDLMGVLMGHSTQEGRWDIGTFQPGFCGYQGGVLTAESYTVAGIVTGYRAHIWLKRHWDILVCRSDFSSGHMCMPSYGRSKYVGNHSTFFQPNLTLVTYNFKCRAVFKR